MSRSVRTALGLARGFTLLELLVALAIFSLLAVMSYGGLNSVMQLQAGTEVEAARLADMQKVYLLMQRDIEQLVDRPVRDEYGVELPAVNGSDNLQLTRAGWNNPLGRPRSNLQRVGYAWQDRRLMRYTWSVLDRAQDTQPAEQAIADDVDGIEIRFLDGDHEWHDAWPPASTGGAGPAAGAGLPRAIEFTLEHAHYGRLPWLFRLPEQAQVLPVSGPGAGGADGNGAGGSGGGAQGGGQQGGGQQGGGDTDPGAG